MAAVMLEIERTETPARFAVDIMETPVVIAPVAQELPRLRKLQAAGQHAEALTEAEALLQLFPDDRDLLLVAAISLRHLNRIDDALVALEKLEQQHPKFSRLHQERGLCYITRKDAPRAIDAFLRAVNINPALPQSWSMLEGLYRLSGDRMNAATAADHIATLRRLPPDVVKATSLFSDGDFAEAEKIVRAFLLAQGDQPEAMRLLAKIGLAYGVLDDAELLLEGVLALAPDYRAARYDYADTLVKRHKYLEAREQVRHLMEIDPSNVDYRSLAAAIAVGLGQQSDAIAIYRGLLCDVPDSPDVNLWLAHALKTVGKVPEAIAAYRKAAAARPSFGDAYWSLANLKTYRFADEEIARMRSEEAAPATPLADRYHLCFALGKALEDRGEIVESWRYYERGNDLKRAKSGYRPEIIETNTQNQIEICDREFFIRREGWGVENADPIFILGLPRSGSTLVEQILASHSLAEGTLELVDIQRIVLDLQGRDPALSNSRYPSVLTEMVREDFVRLGEKYIADTQIYRTGKPFFIDKMPNNFRHIGLIHLMLPNARIIDARREPMSCCFSNLKQLYANGQEFAYSVEDIARYYRTYVELMRHWDEVLPGRVLRVQHEDVVADLESSVRRILDFCGLPFERACVDFHKTDRAVRTPSSEQVRQPIFRYGLDQWKKYEVHLMPLKAALGDALVDYRD